MKKIILSLLILSISQAYAISARGKCVKNGGQISYKKTPSGRGYEVCTFTDNRQCELTSLKRGWCPVGGVKITGYDNEAQIYCAIHGGKVIAEPNATCNLPNRKKIKASMFYN